MSMKEESKRSVRISSRIQEELCLLLARTVRDPRVAGVVVTGVRVTPDLQLARVHVRQTDSPSAPSRRTMLAGMASVGRAIRGELGRRVGLRHAPRLEFFYDESFEQRQHIEALLNEIGEELKTRESTENSG